MKPLSSETRRLLELARDEDAPGAHVRDRVERSLSARLAAGTSVIVTGSAISKSAAGTALAVLVAKPLAVASLTVGIAVAAWQAADWRAPTEPGDPRALTSVGRAQEARVSTKDSPAPATSLSVESDSTPAAPQQLPALKPARALEPQVAHVDHAPADAPVHEGAAVAANELKAETEALRAAQSALRGGDAARALALLDDQQARYRPGLLQQERAAARVMALCQAGRATEARTAAVRFESDFPRSPLVARVRTSCREP
jgi:hypothetical protein